MEYWTWWTNERMQAVRQTCDAIDMFISPSHHLQQRFINEFGLTPEKIKFLPYGFDRSILTHRQRVRQSNEPVVFGYIGRHSSSKGINLLLEAAQQIIRTHPELADRFRIAIYGRPDSTTTNTLQAMAKTAGVSVEWRSEYKNSEIVSRVFNHIDCIVVPSIWDENSPLVIHEAQQCHVPVITANQGGMVSIFSIDIFLKKTCYVIFRAN
jgi:glycosyltransferase involved in cell wall biosynthesis